MKRMLLILAALALCHRIHAPSHDAALATLAIALCFEAGTIVAQGVLESLPGRWKP